jgi:putative ABC transport system ATP-binding protein
MELLVSLTQAEGTTVVLVTHEPRVAAYADRVVLVRDGQVTVAEPPAVPSNPADTSRARPHRPSPAL